VRIVRIASICVGLDIVGVVGGCIKDPSQQDAVSVHRIPMKNAAGVGTRLIDTSTPEAVWASVLTAIRSENDDDLARLTGPWARETIEGYFQVIRQGGSARQHRARADQLAAQQLVWKRRDSDYAIACVGRSEMAETLYFRKSSSGWRLDAWAYAE
jgi:hypothetical protein